MNEAIEKTLDLSSLNEKIFYENICKILKETRKERNLSQDAVAKKIGVTYQQYQKYESGVNRFSLFYLTKVCNYLDININELIDTSINLALKDKKQKVINRNTVINNYYNYGFFNSLITLVKEISMNINKRLFIGTILTCIILFWIFEAIKYTPYNNENNIQLLGIQLSVAIIGFLILFCSVFPVSLLTGILVYTAVTQSIFTLYGLFFHIITGNINFYTIAFSIMIISLPITILIVMYLKRKEKKVS